MDSQALERIDALTGCENLLAFLEKLSVCLKETPSEQPFSLLLIDLNKFGEFNKENGDEQGDRVLRWVSIVLRDTNLPVYRLSGDEFLVLFTEGSFEDRERIAREIFERLNKESAQFNWSNPASVVVIHFKNEKLAIADIWTAVSDALFDVKAYDDRGFMVNYFSHSGAGNSYQLNVINLLTERLLSFATRLDSTHQLAYLDPTSGLPNSRAAEMEMERVINHETSFSILFIDGDNLRLYNTINYSAGDQMIKDLSTVLSNNLRPGDFIARWRVGDEFLVVLPTTEKNKALIVAERMRSAVETASKAWKFPVTISVGLAGFPVDGKTPEELLKAVEEAAKLAKEKGKNQAVNR